MTPTEQWREAYNFSTWEAGNSEASQPELQNKQKPKQNKTQSIEKTS